MIRKPNPRKDSEKLTVYGNAIENALNHSEIKPRLEELGFDETKVNEGQALLTTAKEKYNANIIDADETGEARKAFESKQAEMNTVFAKQRKIAKAVYRNDAEMKARLRVDESIPSGYPKWQNLLHHFYTAVNSNPSTIAALGTLRVSADDLTAAASLLQEVENAKAAYDREMAEDQTATAQKNAAIEALTDWMDDFYEVAKIAMEDEPQLLELLGMRVR
jgi:hypothetical protein